MQEIPKINEKTDIILGLYLFKGGLFMKPKKSTVLCCALALAIILLTACNFSTNKSYTFDVETGDKIKVALDTQACHCLKRTGSFP